MHNDHFSPFLPPPKISDEAALEILCFLYEFIRAFEDYYADQIHRYPTLDPLIDEDTYPDLGDEDDDGPPF